MNAQPKHPLLSALSTAHPRPRADSREYAIERLQCYAGMTPAVIKALPEHGSPPVSARHVSEVIQIGSLYTVRDILRFLTNAGIASASVEPVSRGFERKVYTLAPELAADARTDAAIADGDLEAATAVYAEADETP